MGDSLSYLDNLLNEINQRCDRYTIYVGSFKTFNLAQNPIQAFFNLVKSCILYIMLHVSQFDNIHF